MRLFVIDPGLINRIGHHYEFDLALTRHCRARSIPITIIANSACEDEVAQELGAVRAFSLPPYIRFNTPPEFTVPLRWIRLGETIEKELDLLRFPVFAPDDILLMHTVHSGHANGLYRWYMRLPAPRPAVCLQVMFPPSFQVEPADVGVSTAFLERALSPWNSVQGGRVVIASDNQGLASFLERLLACPVDRLPMPIDFGGEPPEEGFSVRRDGLRLAYLGEGRVEKGFPQMVDLLFRHAGQLAGMRFTLHTGHSGQGSDLSTALRGLPYVDLVDRALSQPEYFALLRDCDAVLLPYDAQAYAMRSSRIFAEALGMAKPVLVTAGTWMEQELVRWGTPGVSLESTAAEGILAALRQLSARFPELCTAARSAAPAFRRENSPAAFVDALIRKLAPGG